MKKFVTFLSLLSVISAALFMFTCQSANPYASATHYVDKTLSRTEQVKKCGSCHTRVYENWKMGPHAYSYKGLKDHDNHLDTSRDFPAGYNAFVEAKIENCAKCHVSKNLYDINFSGIDPSCPVESLKKEEHPKAFSFAERRELTNLEDANTGTDCMTCHVQNNQVVTNFDSKAPDTMGIIKSKLFSTNMNCNNCHFGLVSSLKELADEKRVSENVTCVSCHQEYDQNGKGTHYMYWRRNPAAKGHPERLNIYECVNLKLNTVNGKSELKFSWTNTVMPHQFSEVGDVICTITAVYKDKKEKIILSERLNRKSYSDKTDGLPPHFRVGVAGRDFKYMATLSQLVSLDNIEKIDHFILTGKKKPQWWSSEKEFMPIYEKRIELKEIL